MRLFCPLPVLLKEIIKDWPNDNIAHRFGNSQNVMLHWQEFKVYSFCICIVEYDNDFENLKISFLKMSELSWTLIQSGCALLKFMQEEGATSQCYSSVTHNAD